MQHNTIEPSRQDEVAAYRERLRDVVAEAIRIEDGCGYSILENGPGSQRIEVPCDDPRVQEDRAAHCGCKQAADAAIDAVLKFMSEEDLPDAAKHFMRCSEFQLAIRSLSPEGGAK